MHVMHPPNTLYLGSLSHGVSQSSCGLIQPNLFGEVPVLVVPIHRPPEQGIGFMHSSPAFGLQCRHVFCAAA